MLTLQVRVDLGVMAMKRYFPPQFMTLVAVVDCWCSINCEFSLSSNSQNILWQSNMYFSFWNEITADWILHMRGTDFQSQMINYKFQVFITINVNPLSRHKVLCEETEINNILHLINKDVPYLVQNNFWLEKQCLLFFLPIQATGVNFDDF